MSKSKIVLNRAGVRSMLRSEEAKAICKELAEGIKQRAGDGYEVSTYTGRNRVNASVKAETAQAYYDNLRNNTLNRALR